MQFRSIKPVAVLASFVVVAVLGTTTPALAQEIIDTDGAIPFDRARVSGFVWVGDVSGSVSAPGLSGIPGIRGELDAQTELGLDSSGVGFLVSGDIGLAPRHRVVAGLAGIGHSGEGSFEVFDLENLTSRTLLSETEMSLLDFRVAYQYMYVHRDWVLLGALAGVGYFTSDLDVVVRNPPPLPILPGEIVTEVSETFNSAYPTIGATALFDAEVVAIYSEISGFPSVSVGSQSGWVMNIDIDFIVYPTPNIGIAAGYKRYQLSLEEGDGLGMNMSWDGFIIGGGYVW